MMLTDILEPDGNKKSTPSYERIKLASGVTLLVCDTYVDRKLSQGVEEARRSALAPPEERPSYFCFEHVTDNTRFQAIGPDGNLIKFSVEGVKLSEIVLSTYILSVLTDQKHEANSETMVFVNGRSRNLSPGLLRYNRVHFAPGVRAEGTIGPDYQAAMRADLKKRIIESLSVQKR